MLYGIYGGFPLKLEAAISFWCSGYLRFAWGLSASKSFRAEFPMKSPRHHAHTDSRAVGRPSSAYRNQGRVSRCLHETLIRT